MMKMAVDAGIDYDSTCVLVIASEIVVSGPIDIYIAMEVLAAMTTLSVSGTALASLGGRPSMSKSVV